MMGPADSKTAKDMTVDDKTADYKNWVPRGMVWGAAAATAAFAVANVGLRVAGGRICGPASVALRYGLPLGLAASGAFTVWCALARRRFSYEGGRQLSRAIVEGVAERVCLPEGGTCLDVGCGSGALSIAVARRNPHGRVVGVDLWGPEYASYSQGLCEANARAEGVDNASFAPADARRLPFADETFDAVTSNYVYHNIMGSDKQGLLRETLRTLRKGGSFAIHDLMGPTRYGDMQAFCRSLRDEGYESVKLIPTANGLFMGKAEATLMMLVDSMLLVGVK